MLRSTRDYLRYHEAPFRGATANRGRALRVLVRSVSNGTQELPAEMPDTLLPLNDRSAARLWKALRDLEALIPSDPAFERFIADPKWTVYPNMYTVVDVAIHGCVRNFHPGGTWDSHGWAHIRTWLEPDSKCRESNSPYLEAKGYN